MADELGADQILSDITFRTATEEDKERIKSALHSEGSIHGNVDWAAKLGANLSYSAHLSPTLKRKTMDDPEPTKRSKVKRIIQYKRIFKNKLKVKPIQEETPLPEQNHDQGTEKLDVNIEDKLEGGLSTRLRPRTKKQVPKVPRLVREKPEAKSALMKQTFSSRTKTASGIQASAGKRSKKSEVEHSCDIEGCLMKFWLQKRAGAP